MIEVILGFEDHCFYFHNSHFLVNLYTYTSPPPLGPIPKKIFHRYSAMKKNEMLSFTGKWMELENIILSEVSLAQKTKNHMFSLICGH
jgi:hypothetical protein